MNILAGRTTMIFSMVRPTRDLESRLTVKLNHFKKRFIFVSHISGDRSKKREKRRREESPQREEQ